jgi:hypothetical protein
VIRRGRCSEIVPPCVGALKTWSFDNIMDNLAVAAYA